MVIIIIIVTMTIVRFVESESTVSIRGRTTHPKLKETEPIKINYFFSFIKI